MSQPGLHNAHDLDSTIVDRIGKAMDAMPRSTYIMTSRHENKSQGVMVRWVQRITGTPPLILMVAVPKGSPIIPVLQDAHHFALCQVHPEDKLTLRRFAGEPAEDPFNAIETFLSPGGAPVIARSLTYLDCELLRHVDFEGDHDMYIGLIHEGDRLNKGQPIVQTD